MGLGFRGVDGFWQHINILDMTCSPGDRSSASISRCPLHPLPLTPTILMSSSTPFINLLFGPPLGLLPGYFILSILLPVSVLSPLLSTLVSPLTVPLLTSFPPQTHALPHSTTRSPFLSSSSVPNHICCSCPVIRAPPTACLNVLKTTQRSSFHELPPLCQIISSTCLPLTLLEVFLTLSSKTAHHTPTYLHHCTQVLADTTPIQPAGHKR